MESVSVSKHRLMGEEVATRRSQEVRVALSPSENISLPSQVRVLLFVAFNKHILCHLSSLSYVLE